MIRNGWIVIGIGPWLALATAATAANGQHERDFIAQYTQGDARTIEQAADEMPAYRIALLFRAMTLASASDDGPHARRIAAKLMKLSPSPLDWEARQVLDEAAAPDDAQGHSVLKLKSEGAAIATIDRVIVGVTPVVLRLPPGEYVVAFERSRHELSTRKVSLAPGEVRVVWAALEPPAERTQGIPERDKRFFAALWDLCLVCR